MKVKLAKAALLLGVVCGVLLAQAADTPEPAPSEYQVKAAFLYNFTKFVRWPESAFPGTNSPLVIGILGDNPFGSSLELAVQGKSVAGHPLVVREVNSVPEMKLCQVLFISPKPRRNLAETLATLDNSGVLTVGDTEDFIKAGGMIRFVTEDAKVRFVINDAAAVTAGLTISSKLLNVARKADKSG